MALKNGYSGTFGIATFAGIDWQVVDWSFEVSIESHDVTTKSDGGFRKVLKGKKEGSGKAKMFVIAELHKATPANIKPGATGTIALQMSADGTADSTPAGGTVLLTKTSYDNSMGNAVTVDVEFDFDGSFNLPGETTGSY